MSRERTDFIREMIAADLAAGVHQTVRTRFPPEPNGYLHIGHAKSICLNFGIAQEFAGTCNLRYDDTNPTKEDIEYVKSIEADVRWLGFEPTAVLYSADYFARMYQWAEKLIGKGIAFVCDLTDEENRSYRGTLSEPGKPSPWRERSVAENLDLFRRMKAGEFPDGAKTLRAKIDLASPNMKMRDPLLYRIRHAHHHRSGDEWCIYPMYDYAHPLEDAIEGITHSICTLEFENNRELYDWVLLHTEASADSGFARAPRQYEFARLALDYTVMSKRKLLTLVTGKYVGGWDDPRMPTIAAMRRRGYSAAALRAFCEMVGVAKANSMVDFAKLEHCLRDDLNQNAPRALAVVAPLAVEITNWNDLVAADGSARDGSVLLDAPLYPSDVGKPGSRKVAFGPALWIERSDFAAVPDADFLRLAPGRTVRLRYAYCITCDEAVTGSDGSPTLLKVRLHPETKAGGKIANGDKIWGVIHWVDQATAVDAELRIYEQLFLTAKPEEGGADFLTQLNPNSLRVVRGSKVEAGLASSAGGDRFQFERTGYFVVDNVDSKPGALVFNRIIDLGAAPVQAQAPEREKSTSEPKQKNAKALTRPKGKSPAEFRLEARNRDAELARMYAELAQKIGEHDADLLCGERGNAEYAVRSLAKANFGEALVKWLINEVPRVIGEESIAATTIDSDRLVELTDGVGSGAISSSAAKLVLARLADPTCKGRSVADLVAEFASKGGGSLSAAVAAVITANGDKAAQYRSGKTGLLGFFVGAVMKANPSFDAAAVGEELKARLNA